MLIQTHAISAMHEIYRRSQHLLIQLRLCGGLVLLTRVG